MKKKYISNVYNTTYFMETTPIGDFNIESFLGAMNKLNVIQDNYTVNKVNHFLGYGFTAERVNIAQELKDTTDQMIHFAYDEDFNSPIGLAIAFNGKFYSLTYSKGKRAESELYTIFTNRKPIS